MAEISELVKILDRQRAMIEELGAMARAFNHCYESFSEKWEELVQEGQEMITEYESGEADTSNIKEKMSENLTKTKLMREIVCFMSVTLEEYRKGEEMNENQLVKFKNRLLNIQTQLQGGCLACGKDTKEEQIKSKLLYATQLVREAFEMTDQIRTREVPKAVQKKIRKKIESRYSDLTPSVEIIRRDVTTTYNIQCRNYGEYRDRNGMVIERTCTVGMDMCYCSKNCAYATNNVCSLKG